MTLLTFIVLLVLAVLSSIVVISSAVFKLKVDASGDKQDNKYYIWTLGFTVVSVVLWLVVWAMMPVGGGLISKPPLDHYRYIL